MSAANVLKGIGGELEIGRVLLAGSGVLSLVSPIVFEIYELGWNGGHFDPVAWCTAFPGGLAILSGVGVFTIGRKDRDVTIARQTQAAPPLDDKGTTQS